MILQEIAAAGDQPDDLVFDLAQSAAFGAHPLGRPILGTHELIANVSRDEIFAWRQRNYWASRMVVAAAGNIDHEHSKRRAEKILGTAVDAGPLPARPPGVCVSMELAQKPLDQTHVVLSFAAPGYRNPEIYRLAGSLQPARRGHVVAPLPGSAREAWPLLQRVLLCVRL